MTDGGDNSGRDQRGRFGLGNPGGPRGPRRSTLLRQAAEEAVSPEYIAAMIKRATRMGLEGNLAAMRFVFERVCGRAAEAPADAEPLDIGLPRMRTAADCSLTLERIVNAIAQGTVNRDTATLLIAAVQARLRAIEVTELERKLADLEETAADRGN